MYSLNDQISIRQMQVLLIMVMFSSTSLTLPRMASEFARQDGWLVIIGGVILMMGYVFLIIQLGMLFPGKSFIEYSSEILTKPVGMVLGLFLVIKLFIFFSLEVRVFSELVKATLLPNTPLEFIIISFMFTLVYLTRKGIECRARMAEIVIFLALIPIMIVLLFALKDVKYENMAPVFVLKAQEFFDGSYFLSMKIAGPEFLLLASPFIRTRQNLKKAIYQSILFFLVIGLVINFVTVGIFDPQNTSREIWPVMTIMQVIKLPGAFIDRQDALMMSFWILTMVLLNSTYLFYSSVGISWLFKTKEHNWINLALLPIAYFIALAPDNVPDSYEVMNLLIRRFGILYLVPIPLILLIVAKLRKLGVKNEKS